MASSSTNLAQASDKITDSQESNNPIRRMDSKLYWAAAKGNIEVFKQRVNELCLDELLTPEKNTVLHVHIISSDSITDKTFVEEILKMCPGLLMKPNARGETPLLMAARYGHLLVVEFLINCANLSPPEENDLESANATTIGGEAAKQMMRMRNEDNDTALHEAVRFQHLNVVKLLTEEDPHFSYSTNEASETPLYLAVEGGYKNLVYEILENCSIPGTAGPIGRTVLHAAVIGASEVITRKLLEKIENLTREADEMGCIPLHYAAELGYLEIVELLLDKDECSAYIKNKKGWTALHIAIDSRCPVKLIEKVIEVILIRCPDCCEVVDNEGRNILHFAVIRRHLIAVRLIMKYSSFSNYLLNRKDSAGNTPLLQIGDSHAVEMLNDFLFHPGVNKMSFNKQNMNVLDLALNKIPTNVWHKWMPVFEKYQIRRELRIRIREDDGEDDVGKQKFMSEAFEENRESLLVAATLIATVTFTAGFTLPGGYISNEGSLQGAAVLRNNKAFQAFIITDAIAMVLSITAVFINLFTIVTVFTDKTMRTKYVYHLLSLNLTIFAMGFMIIVFITGTYAMLAPSIALAIITCLIGLSIFVFLFFIIKTAYFPERYYMNS